MRAPISWGQGPWNIESIMHGLKVKFLVKTQAFLMRFLKIPLEPWFHKIVLTVLKNVHKLVDTQLADG
jgi:hypothetical protein